MKLLRLLWLTALMLGSVRAGSLYEVRCETSMCGFKTTLGIGGGRLFDQASGYCWKCGKTASVTWKREQEKSPLHLKFWDALCGRMREVFTCPTCKGPFVMIEQIEDMKHCPKCGKTSLKTKLTVMYD
ncbi:MAG: hypothetical protein J0L73_14730 [Verrucomicrobia bacterium]|nr:hypothetical protein [Verrucomicrobiota bacterium]